MRKTRKMMMTMAVTAAFLSVAGNASGAAEVITAGNGRRETKQEISLNAELSEKMEIPAETDAETTFDVSRFVLPEDAGMLVVVEGTGGSDCRVYAYEKENGIWAPRLQTYGYLGVNGISSDRTEGDKTTPSGLFQMNTPFGQKEAQEGFPSDYLKVTENHQWRTTTNRMEYNPSGFDGDGEAVGTHWYREYYDYAIDCGYNINAIPQKGSAIFLHCIGQGKTSTSGCIAVPEDRMIAIMRMYGNHGDGHCYIALAQNGGFDPVYHAYGANNGLSPSSDVTN